jgi:uncharacterized membrane protein
MTDYLWNGSLADVNAAIYVSVVNPLTQVATNQLVAGYSVIGPTVMDGVAYVNVRTDAVLTTPAGLSVIGVQLSRSVLGDWADVPVIPPTTIIATIDFMMRLTFAERSGLIVAARTDNQLADILVQLGCATTIDVTNAAVISAVDYMVSATDLTAPRGAQILDLTQVSP